MLDVSKSDFFYKNYLKSRIPLDNGVLAANPIDLINMDLVTDSTDLQRFIRRLSFYYIDRLASDVSQWPPNIQMDTKYGIVMYSDFPASTVKRTNLYFDPFSRENLPQTLAVCGFDLVGVRNQQGLTLNIAQFQTAKFDKKSLIRPFLIHDDPFNEYLGFMNYKLAFTLFIEQLALYLKYCHELDIRYVSISQYFKSDRVLCEDDFTRALNNRKKQFGSRGYVEELVVSDYNPNVLTMKSFAKPIDTIVPNQENFRQIFLRLLDRRIVEG